MRSDGLKNNRPRILPGERPRLGLLLQPPRELQQRQHLVPLEIRQVEEAFHAGSSRSARGQQVDVLLLENERRQQAQHVRVGGRAGENAALEQLRLHLLRRPRGAQPDQKPGALVAAHRTCDAGGADVGADAPHARQQSLGLDRREHRLDRRARHRAAAEGGAEGLGFEAVRHGRGHHERRTRKAVAERLGGGEHVGRHAIEVGGERLAGAARRRTAPRRISAAPPPHRSAAAARRGTARRRSTAPASPCTGSTITAAVCVPTWAAIAA